jgi:ATP-dependent RNA helicase DeaD
MQMPSVEDVNSTRIAKFRDRITSSLASDEMGLFRKLVADYEQEHDVPAIDIAAALAAQLVDDRAFLLQPEAEIREREWESAGDRGGPARAAPARAQLGPAAPVGVRPRDGDVPDPGRQAAQGDAGLDRRRDRQRGRAEPQGLRPDRHPR